MAGPGKAKRKSQRWQNITAEILAGNAAATAAADSHKSYKPGKSQNSQAKPSVTFSKPAKPPARGPKRNKAPLGLTLDENFKEQWARLPHEIHETIISYALMHDSPISVDARMDAYPKIYSCRPATLLEKCGAKEQRDHAINRNLIYANSHFRLSFSRIYYESNVFAINLGMFPWSQSTIEMDWPRAALGWKPVIPEGASEEEIDAAMFPGEHYYAAKYIRRVIITADMLYQFEYAPQILRCFENLLEIGFDMRCRQRNEIDSADETIGGWRFNEMSKHVDDGPLSSTLKLANVELGDVFDKERVCSPYFKSKVWVGLSEFSLGMWMPFEVWRDEQFSQLQKSLDKGAKWHAAALAENDETNEETIIDEP